MRFKGLVLFLLFNTSVFASDIMVSVFHSSYLPMIQAHASLIIFDDGKYSLNLSSEHFGICVDSGIAGKFVGQLKPEILKKLKSLLKEVKNECKTITDCTSDIKEERSPYRFVVIDYTNKATKYAFYSDLPKLLNYVSNNLDLFKQNPRKSLALDFKGDELIFTYKGDKPYKTTVNTPSIMLQTQSGSTIKLSSFLKGDQKLKESVLKFKKSGMKKIKLPISANKIKNEIQSIIYTNKVEAHHQDSERKIFTLCKKI